MINLKEAYEKQMAAHRSDDKINPSHYKSAAGLEVIDVIEAFDLDFCRGNAVKYLLRAGKKSGEAEKTELLKAKWYVDRAIAQLEKVECAEDEELPAEVERQQRSNGGMTERGHGAP